MAGSKGIATFLASPNDKPRGCGSGAERARLGVQMATLIGAGKPQDLDIQGYQVPPILEPKTKDIEEASGRSPSGRARCETLYSSVLPFSSPQASAAWLDTSHFWRYWEASWEDS